MAFHRSRPSNMTFGQLNLKDGVMTVTLSTDNGTKVNHEVDSISGYVTKIDTRTNESKEYGNSEEVRIFLHDKTTLAFKYAYGTDVSFKAAQLIARLIRVATAPGGFENEISIRVGNFPKGHIFPDGTVLEKETAWSSVRASNLSDEPIKPYYGRNKDNNQELTTLPETPTRKDAHGNDIIANGRPVKDYTQLRNWVEGAVNLLKERAEISSEVNRQKAQENPSQADESFDPAVLAAADTAAQHQAPQAQPQRAQAPSVQF
ncbi:hypothetical protein [Neopusillimonas maritima]|uniref:Uncharacterized protein n=1 Tax=Neopusillimonas maritima TaxID=2026239 RepID=A0A3A1YW65_9BURK|nr:hypothetical protein [Neopusillimonas maritima]RIY41070.1 hypothetical protein CJP73_07940 [Neopusillimonas maritima]